MQERNLRVLDFPRIREMLHEHAVTDMGRAKCLALEPSGDYEEVIKLQAQTEEANTVMAYSGANPMAYFTDVREYLKLAEVGSTLSAKALLDVAEALKASRIVRASLVNDREDTPLLSEMGSRLATNRNLEEEIFSAILSEDEISDHASNELYSIRRHMRQINDKVRDKLNSIIHSQSMSKFLQDGIITMRNGRYVVPVKAECRQFVPGLVHDQSGSGSTLFIEPMSVVEAGNELKEWTLKERKEIDRILAEFSARIAPDAGLIRSSIEMLSEIDMIFAKAMLGREMSAVPPKLNNNGRINLIRARHPLIDPEKVVPSNIWIGGDFTTLIVTGPNTGGKTVTLKTVGLLGLMTQSGLQIPAQYGSEMAVFDEIFADIGDEQSIEQSLSTFSSHMTNIVSILSSVTRDSLALFDELGAGTDPTEGAALAMSILEHLLKIRVTTMATTHYSELKVFALTTKGVENASVEFNIETLRPTYRLSIGVPGKSNAFEISRKLGLPDFLIDDAGKRLTKDQVRFEDVIANAEYHRQVAERERELAEKAHIETTRLRDEAEKLTREMNARREDEIRKAKAEAKKILVKAQRESEQIISELKKTRANANIKEHELHELRARLQGGIDENSEKIEGVIEGEVPKDPKVGDTVLVTTLGVKGKVAVTPDSKGDCVVHAGALKLKVNISNLRTAAPDEPKHEPKKSSSKGVSVREVQRECDLRGMNVEEALLVMDTFIDNAVLNRLNEVYIIHGKGTGVLRAGVQKRLKKHPSVKEFRLGVYGEGEDGVTVVTLK